MKDMKEWFMLYIEGATLEDISAAFDRGERGFAIHSYCLGFVDCRIKDTAPIKASGLRLSELVVHSKVEDMIYEQMKNCRICPRECGADRTAGSHGFCLLRSYQTT